MSNPVLVEVTRGGRVESRHRGAVVVADTEGASVFAVGNVDATVFPRSAVKAMQALPLIETLEGEVVRPVRRQLTALGLEVFGELPRGIGVAQEHRRDRQVLREVECRPLVAARRKAMLIRFARLAANRLHELDDPEGARGAC